MKDKDRKRMMKGSKDDMIVIDDDDDACSAVKCLKPSGKFQLTLEL